MNAKDIWYNLFDISLEKYRAEDSNIRNMAMILHVFQLEFKKISKYVNELQQKNEIQFKTIQNFEHELKNTICNCKMNNRSPLKTIIENKTPLSSPKINEKNSTIDDNDEDIFNVHISEVDLNVSKENDGSLFVDDSFATFNLSSSPTLNNRKSRSFRAPTRNQNLNNSSIIHGTPTLKVNKVKKLKQSKLPISFSVNERTLKNCNDTDATFCFPGRKLETEINKTCDEVEIDDIINEFNSSSPTHKKIKLNNSYDRPTLIPDSPKISYKREVVRKKADRLQMQGWGCPDCEKYYVGLNLPEAELKKRMDKCSKHRENFNPNRLTPEGFWDPDFTPTQNSFAFDL